MSASVHVVSILQQGQSRKTVDEAIKWVGNDPEKFGELVQLIKKHPDQSIRNRAAWALSYLAESSPEWLTPHWKDLVKLLQDPESTDAVKRNLFRFMQVVKVPQKHHAAVINRSMEVINDPAEDIAIRAFAITTAFNMVKLYPEIAGELRLSLELILPYASAGLKNRAQKTLVKLNRFT